MSSSDSFDWVDTADWWCLDGAPREMTPTTTGRRGRPAKLDNALADDTSKAKIISRNIKWHCDRLGIENADKLRDRMIEYVRSKNVYSRPTVQRAYSGGRLVSSLDQFHIVFGIPESIPLDAEDHIERAKEYIAKPASEAAKKAVKARVLQIVEHATILRLQEIENFLDSIS